MIAFLIYLFLIGIIAGFLARLAVPGRDPMSFWGTVLLGVVGSFIGGFLSSLLFGGRFEMKASGILGSILGAIIALLIYRATLNRRTSRAL